MHLDGKSAYSLELRSRFSVRGADVAGVTQMIPEAYPRSARSDRDRIQRHGRAGIGITQTIDPRLQGTLSGRYSAW